MTAIAHLDKRQLAEFLSLSVKFTFCGFISLCLISLPYESEVAPTNATYQHLKVSVSYVLHVCVCEWLCISRAIFPICIYSWAAQQSG